jgi:hypothetical protein
MNNLYYIHEGETFDETCIGELNAVTHLMSKRMYDHPQIINNNVYGTSRKINVQGWSYLIVNHSFKFLMLEY